MEDVAELSTVVADIEQLNAKGVTDNKPKPSTKKELIEQIRTLGLASDLADGTLVKYSKARLLKIIAEGAFEHVVDEEKEAKPTVEKDEEPNDSKKKEKTTYPPDKITNNAADTLYKLNLMLGMIVEGRHITPSNIIVGYKDKLEANREQLTKAYAEVLKHNFTEMQKYLKMSPILHLTLIQFMLINTSIQKKALSANGLTPNGLESLNSQYTRL